MSEGQTTTVSTSSIFLTRVGLKNFRVSRDVSTSFGRLVCLFGPNGCGKSTFLKAISFVSNYVSRGAIDAYALSGGRSSLLSQQTETTDELAIEVATEHFEYRISLSHQMAKMGHAPDELLTLHENQSTSTLFQRTKSAIQYTTDLRSGDSAIATEAVLDPDASAWQQFLVQHTQRAAPSPRAIDLYLFRSFLQEAFFLKSRSIELDKLAGYTPASQGRRLRGDGLGLWNCWRNLRDNPASYPAYVQAKSWTQRAFPNFNDFRIEKSDDNSLSVYIMERALPEPYPPELAPDGLLQFAVVICALYAPGNFPSLLLLDEPDLSLHPWAQFVLAEAIQDATQNWQRQVILATHSPTLLSQFPEDCLFLASSNAGETSIKRVSDLTEGRDLIEQYAVGSLYMMQLLGEQSHESMVHEVGDKE